MTLWLDFRLLTPIGVVLTSFICCSKIIIWYFEAEQNQIRALRALLFCFEAVSSFWKWTYLTQSLFQLEKFTIRRRWLTLLDVNFPMKFLLLGLDFRAKSIWEEVIEKIEHILAGWKRLHLLKGGRTTLIKSTVQITSLLLITVPNSSVWQYIEKHHHDFLWRGLGDQLVLPPDQEG